MTRRRYDEHSTEFGLWLREQEPIASKLGYVATNLDYIWSNYKTGEWMLIEEKRYNAKMTFAQTEQFRALHCAAISDPLYRGFHLVVFEVTSPTDGVIRINNEVVTELELIDFLMFKTRREPYFNEPVLV